MSTTSPCTRRSFLQLAAAAGGLTTVRRSTAAASTAANSKLNLAFIGSGGWIAQHAYGGGCSEENLVAFCDVDPDHAAGNMAKWRTTQPFFEDFRVMFDEVGDQIDAVVVSTPDHTHFPAAMEAIQRGKHVYVQKPLAHDVWQVRTLRKAAHRYQVVTQMGNQSHASDGIRSAVEWYRAGLIGDVREAHGWNSGPDFHGQHFSNPATYPPPSAPKPDRLNFDLWLGPAASRPYSPDYLPKKWRSFWDFGDGVLGDWGCHTLDMPVWALDLDDPTGVEVVDRRPSLDGVLPPASVLKYHFPAKGDRDPVTLTWYDGLVNGNDLAKVDAFDIGPLRGGGSLLIGETGAIRSPGHPTSAAILPTQRRDELKDKLPPKTIPRVDGGSFREWIRAIKGEGPPPGSNFDVSAKLTEIILLGVVAQRTGKSFAWDAEKATTGQTELDALLKQPVRKGWSYGEDLWRS